MEVLGLMASGLRTAEIASELGVSFFTARNQLSSLMRKLNVRNRTEAVVRATESGLL
jgi:DNA-binding NarL/FixJ family response regulator